MTAIRRDAIRSALRGLYRRQAKVLAFFDTCYSGATGEGSRDLPPDVDRLISELTSPENGVIVFMSSTGREVAWEKPEWENGVFTEALLEAFAGKAARSGQRYLTVADLQNFVPRRARELAERQQNPQRSHSRSSGTRPSSWSNSRAAKRLLSQHFGKEAAL